MVSSTGMDDGVTEAVVEGYRSVELAQRGVDESLVASLAGLARALYFAGDLDQAWSAASRALEHPDATRRPPGHAVARATLALIAADRDHLTVARGHADAARAIVGRISSSRSWLGGIAAEAVGAVLAAESDLAAAERELAYAERFFADDVATIEHALVLLRLVDVRRRRGRLDEAAVSLRRAREELAELGDSGVLPQLVDSAGAALDEARAQASVGDDPRASHRGGARRSQAPVDGSLSARDRRGAVPVSQHRALAHSRRVSKARRGFARGCGRPGGGAGSVGGSAITQVIKAESHERRTRCANVSAWAKVGHTESRCGDAWGIWQAIPFRGCGFDTRTETRCSSVRFVTRPS